MKAKLNRKFIIIALALISIICGALLCVNQNAVDSYANLNVNIEGQEIYANYDLNQQFTVPQAKIIYEQNEYEATHYSLQYPDGKAYIKESYTLNQVGKYTVRYSATAQGKRLSATVSFVVLDKLYSVSGVNSSAYYGYEEKGGNNAIIVKLSVGDEFVFNKPINLNDNTKINNVLSLYTTGEPALAKEVKLLRIRLTDVLDATNYIEVITVPNPWESDDGNRVTYTGARANNQESVGLHLDWKNSATALVFDGVKYNVHRNINVEESKGYPSYGFAFDAKDGYGVKQYKLSMDYNEKKLYGGEPTSPYANGMITDLDEPMIYKDLWSGFKSGYAILSISADSYSGSEFNFAITDIDGEDLSGANYVDTIAPNVQVELPNGQAPNAIVGKPYEVFSATAVDENDGVVNVNAYVFYGYDTNVKVPVEIENGKFTPKFSGVYDLVYLATDKAGNVAEKIIKITVKQNSNLEITVGEYEQNSVLAGSRVVMPSAQVQGNDGEAVVSVVATLQNSQVSYELSACEGGYEFVPLYAGEYSVVYTVSDYVNSVTQNLTLTVQASSTPIIKQKPSLPTVYVKGCEYTIPAAKGYSLDSGTPVESDMNISYSFDGGEELPYQGKITVTANDYVSVIYSLGSYKKTYEIDVVDVGKGGEIIKKNYFYAPDFTASSDTDKTSYVTSVNGAKMQFIKPILVSEFNFKFRIETKNFEQLNIILTDIENANTVLKISITQSPQNTQFYSINGSAPQSIIKYLEDSDITIQYYNGESYLVVGDDSISVGNFSGFESFMANLEIELLGVTGESELIIYELNNEGIDNKTYDKFKAQYYCDISSGIKKLGDYIRIGKLYIADVLSFESSAYITVYDPDGNVCVATDGTEMDKVSDFSKEYLIEVSAYGEYLVEIRYVDKALQLTNSNGGKFSVDYVSIEAMDNVAPVISLGKVNTQSGKGKIAVATATVTDNIDESVELFICVTGPDQVTKTVVNGSFTANVSGTYVVSYYATDSVGNLGFVSYEIEVK